MRGGVICGDFSVNQGIGREMKNDEIRMTNE
jgi:hypothetical protein